MNRFLLIISLFVLLGCKKEKENKVEKEQDNCSYTVSGRFITNPYEIGALKQQTGLENIPATHEYVKVWIETTEDWKKWDAAGDFLPFDWRKEPEKDLSHKLESNTGGLWIYGLVPVQTSLPQGKVEFLEKSYLPEPGDQIWKRLNPDESFTGAKVNNQVGGKVRFFDPVAQQYVPLKGVTVIIKDGGRTIQSATDESGNFSNVNKINADKAEILLRFDNANIEVRTLDFNDLGGILTPNILSVGMMTKCSFQNLDITIGQDTKNNKLYNSACALYAYQKFMEFSKANNYGIPENKLNFWIAKDAPLTDGYAAPMLRHVGSELGTRDLLIKLFGIPPALANSLGNMIKKDLPDIYAPYYSDDNDRTSPYHLEVLYHEFGHATHYTKAGKAFWSEYINHIFNNGGYGGGGDIQSGLVAMSESWAEDFSMELLAKVYGSAEYTHELRDKNLWGAYRWIPVGIYYDLYDDADNETFDKVSGFSFEELYSIFSPETNTPQKFRDELFVRYPGKAEPQRQAIFDLFRYYGYQ